MVFKGVEWERNLIIIYLLGNSFLIFMEDWKDSLLKEDVKFDINEVCSGEFLIF